MPDQLALDDDAREAVGMPERGGDPLRYTKLAEALLAAPDPVYAIAHELGGQAGRIDALARRLHAIEARFADLRTR